MVLSVDNILEDFPKLLSTCGVDTGDHISASTDSGYVQPQSDCLICKILNRQSDYPEHILYETDNFFVVPGTGAFYEGYIMIVPKRHVMSFANLNESELDEFFMVYSNLSAILSSIYNKPILDLNVALENWCWETQDKYCTCSFPYGLYKYACLKGSTS